MFGIFEGVHVRQPYDINDMAAGLTVFVEALSNVVCGCCGKKRVLFFNVFVSKYRYQVAPDSLLLPLLHIELVSTLFFSE